MNQATTRLRCRMLLTSMNVDRGWHLAPELLESYAEALAALLGERSIADDQLQLMLGYYHSEHRLVAALRNTGHPEHLASWAALSAQVRRILGSRLGGAQLSDQASDLDDLTQNVLIDVARGLTQYRYQSRFQTWLFTVLSHAVHRSIRAQRAQKRGEASQIQSLEGLAHGDAVPAALQLPGPEAEVQLRVLTDLLAAVLATNHDQRLAAVVRLWLLEELPLRAIGARLELSVGRVHALLAQALALLQADSKLQAWAGIASTLPSASTREEAYARRVSNH